MKLRVNDWFKRGWLLLAMLASLAVQAMEPIEFRNVEEEARFRTLTAELRCVMCQNQSLADSEAPIAHDLRLEVLKLMREGRDDAQIKQYLVERYTDFVLYQPPVRPGTWLLWFGPLALLCGGAVLVALIVRRRGQSTASNSTSAPDDQEW